MKSFLYIPKFVLVGLFERGKHGKETRSGTFRNSYP
jgi:hypothetical protein